MSQQPEPTRRGFASPLQKAQAGKIGGGRSTPPPEKENRPAAPPPTAAAEPEQPAIKTPTARQTRERERITVYLPPHMVQRIRRQAADERKEISLIVERLLEPMMESLERN